MHTQALNPNTPNPKPNPYNPKPPNPKPNLIPLNA